MFLEAKLSVVLLLRGSELSLKVERTWCLLNEV